MCNNFGYNLMMMMMMIMMMILMMMMMMMMMMIIIIIIIIIIMNILYDNYVCSCAGLEYKSLNIYRSQQCIEHEHKHRTHISCFRSGKLLHFTT